MDNILTWNSGNNTKGVSSQNNISLRKIALDLVDKIPYHRTEIHKRFLNDPFLDIQQLSKTTLKHEISETYKQPISNGAMIPMIQCIKTLESGIFFSKNENGLAVFLENLQSIPEQGYSQEILSRKKEELLLEGKIFFFTLALITTEQACLDESRLTYYKEHGAEAFRQLNLNFEHELSPWLMQLEDQATFDKLSQATGLAIARLCQIDPPTAA